VRPLGRAAPGWPRPIAYWGIGASTHGARRLSIAALTPDRWTKAVSSEASRSGVGRRKIGGSRDGSLRPVIQPYRAAPDGRQAAALLFAGPSDGPPCRGTTSRGSAPATQDNVHVGSVSRAGARPLSRTRKRQMRTDAAGNGSGRRSGVRAGNRGRLAATDDRKRARSTRRP
jgi:hypothetical protein